MNKKYHTIELKVSRPQGKPLGDWQVKTLDGKVIMSDSNRAHLHHIVNKTHQPHETFGVSRWVPRAPKSLPSVNDSNPTADFAEMLTEKGKLKFMDSLRHSIAPENQNISARILLREFVGSALASHRRGERTDLLNDWGKEYL